jgi:hypothetical protein
MELVSYELPLTCSASRNGVSCERSLSDVGYGYSPADIRLHAGGWNWCQRMQSFVQPDSISYSITGQDRPTEIQEVETSRISRQSAHEGGKVVSPTHRPSLPPGNNPGTHFC